MDDGGVEREVVVKRTSVQGSTVENAAVVVEVDYNEGSLDPADTHLANIDLAIDAGDADSCHDNNAADQLPVPWMANFGSEVLW